MSRYEEDDDIRTALLNMYGLGRQMTPRPKKEMTTRELLSSSPAMMTTWNRERPNHA